VRERKIERERERKRERERERGELEFRDLAIKCTADCDT